MAQEDIRYCKQYKSTSWWVQIQLFIIKEWTNSHQEEKEEQKSSMKSIMIITKSIKKSIIKHQYHSIFSWNHFVYIYKSSIILILKIYMLK